jgi:hypothetical protein
MRVTDFFTEALPDEVAKIAASNKIADPNRIFVGQKIVLPNGNAYTIAPGDTLSGIASGQFKGTTPQNTVRAGPNPNIRPDTRIRAAATVPKTTPGASPPTVQPSVSGSEQPIAAVVRGGSGFTDVQTADGQTQRRIGVRNWRNNNPGNLEYGPFAKSKGAIGTDGRFAVFATLEDGLRAKKDLVFGPRYINLSIQDALNKYAPPSENNTTAYIQSVVKATGVAPETALKSLTPSQQTAFLDAINRVEGFKVGRVQQLDTTLNADIHEAINPADTVKMDVPLLLRIMEYSKEDAQSDMDLHHVVEKLIQLSAQGHTLNMDQYDQIVGSVQETGNPVKKLVKDIEYDPDEEVQEGHGRYWCSTDKRWKERKGPKQSRS